MVDIQDRGKVWLRGKVKPIPAVKFEESIIILDLEYGDLATVWGSADGLCVDLHIINEGTRIARWFPKEAQGNTSGTLFSGFDNTKHADILAVLPDNPVVLEKKFSGETYGEVKDLSPESFFDYSGLV